MRWKERERERGREAGSLYRANLGHYSCGGFLELITHEVVGRSFGRGGVKQERRKGKNADGERRR